MCICALYTLFEKPTKAFTYQFPNVCLSTLDSLSAGSSQQFSYLKAFGCAGLFVQISQLTILDNEAESRLLNYILANPTVEHAVRLTLHAPTPPRPTHVRGFPFADLNRRFTPLLTSITIMKHKYGLVSKANPVIE
jgi:hypothetical protein